MDARSLSGCFTALISPMDADGSLDEATLAEFVDWQVRQGAHGLVPVGTTGESPTLSHAEHRRIVDITVQVAGGRVPVLAGAGSNSTAEAIDLARHARAAGADAILVVAPYYNRPTQEGLFIHFSAIADAVDIPLVVYNVPSRTAVDIDAVTMSRLSGHPNIVGVKDATGDMARPTRAALSCGPDFVQLSGEDQSTLPFLAAGGHGSISVTANVAPALCAGLHDAWREGRLADAAAAHRRLMPLHDALFAETSPGPVKYAASPLGRGTQFCRLPLAPVAEDTRLAVRQALTDAGLLN
jgi:4-hydroxy-tetrahydrodipicolinate synthase